MDSPFQNSSHSRGEFHQEQGWAAIRVSIHNHQFSKNILAWARMWCVYHPHRATHSLFLTILLCNEELFCLGCPASSPARTKIWSLEMRMSMSVLAGGVSRTPCPIPLWPWFLLPPLVPLHLLKIYGSHIWMGLTVDLLIYPNCNRQLQCNIYNMLNNMHEYYCYISEYQWQVEYRKPLSPCVAVPVPVPVRLHLTSATKVPFMASVF